MHMVVLIKEGIGFTLVPHRAHSWRAKEYRKESN